MKERKNKEKVLKNNSEIEKGRPIKAASKASEKSSYPSIIFRMEERGGGGGGRLGMCVCGCIYWAVFFGCRVKENEFSVSSVGVCVRVCELGVIEGNLFCVCVCVCVRARCKRRKREIKEKGRGEGLRRNWWK